MGDSRLGKIIPQQTKRVGLAIAEQQQDLLNGDKEVYQEFTRNIELIRVHLSTFDDDFRKTRGRLQDALKLLEKYIKRDFNFHGKRKGLKFDAEQQLFFVQHSELIVRGIIARIVVPDKFQGFVDGLDLEFYSTISRKLSVRTAVPPSKEVMNLAVNQMHESFQNMRLNNTGSDPDSLNYENLEGYPGSSNATESKEGDTIENSLDIIRERLDRMNVDATSREVLEAQSDQLLRMAREFDRSMRITRSASPPRQTWGDIKEEELKVEEIDEATNEMVLETIAKEKKEEEDPIEKDRVKKVRFAVINKRNGGLYESVKELILFDHVNTSYRVDIGRHIAMKYDGENCDIGFLMGEHSKCRHLRELNSTIKKERTKDKLLRNIVRGLRADGSSTSKYIRTPIHLDLQPLDGSNKFNEQDAEEYLVSCALMMTRFSSNWAGVTYPRTADCTELNEHESNVFGILLLSDSLFEFVSPNFFLNAAVFSLPPPLTLDDMLAIFNKTRYDNLLIREIIISFGHDLLTYTDRVTDETVEAAVRATFEAVDRLENLFKGRRDEFKQMDPKFAMILDISSEVTKVKENPMPNLSIVTIPEYGDRMRYFAQYNEALRRIVPFMKNCKLIDWAKYNSEYDVAFMEQEDQGYDSHKRHVETRLRHLARMLYYECFLLQYRSDTDRFPQSKMLITYDNMI